jgi:tetratricopeptide (TPR) repeat protein
MKDSRTRRFTIMAKRNLSAAIALAAVLLVCGALSAAADPPKHLVPFPEDAAGNQASEAKPAKPQPPKSNFKPNFRAPAVKQAQHLEPASDKPAAEARPEAAQPSEQPTADPQPSDAKAAKAPGSEGVAVLEEAFAKSKTAAADGDYTEVIEMCHRAATFPLTKEYRDYARQLTGWAHTLRGEGRAKEGRGAEALADFEAAVEAAGTARAIHNRGASYAALGRDQEARADFDRAIAMNRRLTAAWFNRAELRSKEHDEQGAIRDYTAAIALGPPSSAMYTGRGHAYYRMQKFGDALRDYGEAVKLDPANAAALINRGDTYSDVGKYGEAAKDYRAAVKVAPKNGRAFQAAAWLMATCPDGHYRDEKLAVDAAQRAIELDGATYRNLSTLAASQAAAGMFKEAQATQEQAIGAASKADVVTAEKMMGLYQREIAYRDRPFTAFTAPEELDEGQVRQASGTEPAGTGAAPEGRRAWFTEPGAADQGELRQSRRLPPPAEVQPGPEQPQRPPKARLFAPKGRI